MDCSFALVPTKACAATLDPNVLTNRYAMILRVLPRAAVGITLVFAWYAIKSSWIQAGWNAKANSFPPDRMRRTSPRPAPRGVQMMNGEMSLTIPVPISGLVAGGKILATTRQTKRFLLLRPSSCSWPQLRSRRSEQKRHPRSRAQRRLRIVSLRRL